jgi:hypothetical protein
MAEAGEMLGVTERTFRRWSDRYEAAASLGFPALIAAKTPPRMPTRKRDLNILRLAS